MAEIVHQIFASGKGLVFLRFQSDAKVVIFGSSMASRGKLLTARTDRLIRCPGTVQKGGALESYFGNLAPAIVADLRGRDPAIAAICQLRDTVYPVSFSWLRQSFGRQNGTQGSLDRGRAVLSLTDHLDQYLYSHGLMIKSQWDEVCSWLSVPINSFRLIDYGCGQGLAGLLLFDRFGTDLFRYASQIVLIEPSDVALIRAEAVYRSITPNSPIYCVQKGFSELSAEDFMPNPTLETVHVFSNVLDIEGFDQIELFRKALTNGRHTAIVVSHDRDHAGGSNRISSLKAAVESPDMKPWISIVHSDCRKFKCNNPSQSDAIGWILQMDVSNV